MKAVAYQHLGSRAEAEDAVQETFIKIHRSAAGYSGEASFSSWMFRVLVNTCNDMLRKRVRRPSETELETLSGRIEESLAASDAPTKLTLQKLISELEPHRRSVLLLFEVEGFAHAEIADILGISEAYSKWILFETKKEMRKRWKTND
jgi:RNA polymerase sigma-70 factor (ECF subfamily)